MLLITISGVNRMVLAHTGAPIDPKTKLTPTLRRKVLFPAMLEPVMILICPLPMVEKLLVTILVGGING